MRAVTVMVIAVGLVAAGCAMSRTPAGANGSIRPDVEPWIRFVETLKAGGYPAEDVRPYDESLRQPLVGFLDIMRRKANWKEWRKPKVFREEDELHFVLDLTFDRETATYCFSFLREGDGWHFEHLEAITLPMDRLGSLPLRSFPDLPEDKKAWIREEMEVSQEIRMFNTLAANDGAEAALNWFRDGAGYALAARAWIPYVTPSRALILYLCWEQANLRGHPVVLERLDADSAVVRMDARYFRLYEQAAHLKQQIQPDLYRRLFETRWRDRASAAGWELALSCEGAECIFRFGKAHAK